MVIQCENEAFDAAQRRPFHRLADAQARHYGLRGALVVVPGGVVLGVQGGQSGVMGFTASLAEKTDAEPAVVVPRHTVARRLFAARGLVMPWIRPGEAVWLERALQGDPGREDRLLAFLSWTALRQAEADAGLYGPSAGLVENGSPFDHEPESETNPPSETNLLSPS